MALVAAGSWCPSARRNGRIPGGSTVSGTASRTARSRSPRAREDHPVARDGAAHPDAVLSQRAAYGIAALTGFVLGNALFSVARHRSVAGALLLLITVLGGILLLIGNEEAIVKRGFRTDAGDRVTAGGLFS